MLEDQSYSLGGFPPEDMEHLLRELLARQANLEKQIDELRQQGEKGRDLDDEQQRSLGETHQRDEIISALLESSRAVMNFSQIPSLISPSFRA